MLSLAINPHILDRRASQSLFFFHTDAISSLLRCTRRSWCASGHPLIKLTFSSEIAAKQAIPSSSWHPPTSIVRCKTKDYIYLPGHPAPTSCTERPTANRPPLNKKNGDYLEIVLNSPNERINKLFYLGDYPPRSMVCYYSVWASGKSSTKSQLSHIFNPFLR